MSENSLHAILDRPNSYIGRSVPRPNIRRLLQGRGSYVDDVRLPRMVHVAFVRSPYAHAQIDGIDTDAALNKPGVVAVVTGAELAEYCTPWVGVLSHLAGLKSQPQHAIAIRKASWQGEAIAAVVAETRAQAEDGVDAVQVQWTELPIVANMEKALDDQTPIIHPDLGDNLAWQRTFDAGDIDAAFATGVVVEEEFSFGRHTGVTLEPRAILSSYEPAESRLTVHHSCQAPHMMQNIFATHLGLEEHDVRIICGDVGGSYGIKVHTYADEMATAALSVMLRRPVKFIADRLESFLTDIHARDHRIKGRIAISESGQILGIEIDDLTGIGPYSVYPRTSGIEANQIVNLTGAQYTCSNYRANTAVVFQNKVPMCQYRAVGHPIATAVTEGLVDAAAAAINMDPIEVRKENLIPDDAYPCTAATGLSFESLSHHAALDRLVDLMDYTDLRAEQIRLREKGIYRGIGIATFIELTNPSAMFYGVGGARISAKMVVPYDSMPKAM